MKTRAIFTALLMLAVVLVSPPSSSAVEPPGEVFTFGQNDLGQLGDGSNTNSSIPVPIDCCGASGDVIDLAGGRHHSVLLTEDGTVYAWGQNVYGQVGDGTTVKRNTPVAVLSGADIVDVTAGHYHSMAMTSTGDVYVWGRNDTSQLGLTGGNRTSPTLLSSITDAEVISGGRNHSAVVRTGGVVWTFGLNTGGQLGIGSLGGEFATPTEVDDSTGIEPIVSIRAGRDNTYAISDDGSLFVWGPNSKGQVGDGTTTDRDTPFEVTLGGPVADAGGGAFHSVAVRTNGNVYGWGLNSSGEVGNGGGASKYTTPQSVSGLTNGVSIGAGRNHSLAVRSDGTAVAWGKNDFGQLGDGTTTNRDEPVTVVGMSDVTVVEGGRSHSRVLSTVGGGGPDTVDPSVNWTNPANNSTVPAPVSLEATATDNVGVTLAKMVVRDTVNGTYWDPASNTWGGFEKFDVAVDSPGATSTTLSVSFTPPSGGSGEYRARVWSFDAAGNESTVKNVDFDVSGGGGPDTVDPTATWTAPANNSTVSAPVSLEGDADDNVGIQKMRMVLRDVGTGDYWDPASNSWGGFKKFDVAVDSPGAASTSFTQVFTPPAGGSGDYRARIWAVDTSNNESSVRNRDFEVSGGGGPDTTNPTATWTAPGNNSTVSAPVSLEGDADDNIGVQKMRMVVRDKVTNDYWDPSTNSWSGSFKKFDVSVDSPGAASTSFTQVFDPPAGGSGEYRARIWAVDTSNNESNVKQRDFDVS